MNDMHNDVFGILGRADFIGGIDNEALDFGHLESFNPSQSFVVLAPAPGHPNNGGTPSHLPESPPDSGSEPPQSPGDLHTLHLAQPLSVNAIGGGNGAAGGGASYHNMGDIHGGGSHHAAAHQNDMGSLSDMTQGPITLNNVNDIQIPHHLISSSPNYYNMRGDANLPPPNQQPPPSTLSTNPSPQHLNQGNTIDLKSENLLLPSVSSNGYNPETQSMQTNSENILNLENHNEHTQNFRNGAQGISINDQMHGEPFSRHLSDVCRPVAGVTLLPPNTRKRKLSQADVSGSPAVKPEPPMMSPLDPQSVDGNSMIGSPTATPGCVSNECSSLNPASAASEAGSQILDSSETCQIQCIRFSPFQQQNWHALCDQSLQELPFPHYRVDADKGFNFSNSDDAFVCQKKNHFQITCHAQLQGNATFVKTPSGLEKIKSFHLHFYGVKLETPTQMIRVEQSQSDRTKKPFHPVPIDLFNCQVSKVTVGRLHFSETTSNNMRKKGRPNPEQRYFQLVVGLHAHTHSGNFQIISHGSERIIVRASNPGQFESDVELCWQRGATHDSIFHTGRVGINTDRPDESLVVHGNLKISGHIVQPSDSRAKQEIRELDTAQQLKNLQRIRVVRYRYEPEFAVHSGLCTEGSTEILDTGVIAQEIREILPDAVHETGSIQLPNGNVIDNFLVVNKDRILMENIGAVKELCKVTGSLETRIEQLERINYSLTSIQKISSTKCKTIGGNEENEACSIKTIQMIIGVLIIIMAICLTAITTLYFVEHTKEKKNLSDYKPSHSNGFDIYTTIKPEHSNYDPPFIGTTMSSTSLLESDLETKNPFQSTKRADQSDPIEDSNVENNLIYGSDAEISKKNTSKAMDELSKTDLEPDQDLQNLNNDPGDHRQTDAKHTSHDPIGTPSKCEKGASTEQDGTICKSHCHVLPNSIPDTHSALPDELDPINNDEASSETRERSINTRSIPDGTISATGVHQVILKDPKSEETSTSNAVNGPELPKSNPNECYDINLTVVSATLNERVGSDKICPVQDQEYKISYNIVLSRYFAETDIQLVFVTNPTTPWRLCNANFQQIEKLEKPIHKIKCNVEKSANISIDITIPHLGHYEHLYALRAFFAMENGDLPSCDLKTGNKQLSVVYTIKLLRDCD